MTTIDDENTLRNALRNGVSLFLGAGFSILAKDHLGRNLPLGSELRDELADFFHKKDLAGLSLSRLATILESTQRDAFHNFLRERFDAKSISSSYSVIERIPSIRSIFTTNIDNIIHKIFENSHNYYINDIDLHGASYPHRSAINVNHLHGCILHKNRPFLFGSHDLAAAFGNDRDRWHQLTESLQRHPTIFWGYGLEDAGVLEAINPTTIANRDKHPMWIICHPDIFPSDQLEWLRSLSFRVILATTASFLDWLNEAIPLLPNNNATTIGQSPGPINTLREYMIPPAGATQVRPLDEFYLGGSPTWYDIQHHRIPKLSSLNTLTESIYSDKHVVVVGEAATGKTTLMMQAATQIESNALILVCSSVTRPQAHFIILQLSGKPAKIFIDDAFDSLDAINEFSKHANIQLICIDRSYNYDIVGFRISSLPHHIIDVTELTSMDVQKVIDSIPQNLRHNGLQPRPTRSGSTIFEIVDQSVNRSSLRSRYKAVLQELKEHDRIYSEFLLLSCYVHSCRVPLSMDMLIAFFRNDINHYDTLYQLQIDLRSFVDDYLGPLCEGPQDYFMPKSHIVAEAVLQQADSEDLRAVLLKFLREVSPYRIPRYDTFQRRAYDNELIFRAFRDWNEGREFYDNVFARHSSPYILQHGALYLSKNRQFDLAFAWIDQAIAMKDGNTFTIRNSHAIILFDANINRPDTDGSVRESLDRSMYILKDCRDHDRRSVYHVLTYTRQAIRYLHRYRDSVGSDYVMTAISWLEEELSRAQHGKGRIAHQLASARREYARQSDRR